MWGCWKVLIVQFLTAVGWGLPLPAPLSAPLLDLSCVLGCPQPANLPHHNTVITSPKPTAENERELSEQLNAPLTTPTVTSAQTPSTVNEPSEENGDTKRDDSSSSDSSNESSSESDDDDNDVPSDKINSEAVAEPDTALVARALKSRVLHRRRMKRRGDYRSLALQSFQSAHYHL
ncbi:hypothetical protein IWQ61_009238 [Dispira simplex]|nr:hypothetical protein IWQ61_009238 [Dispira simplex]